MAVTTGYLTYGKWEAGTRDEELARLISRTFEIVHWCCIIDSYFGLEIHDDNHVLKVTMRSGT
jgi:hypothetical protein